MSNQIVISSGAKLRNLNGVITGTTGVLDSVPLGGANGVATLDSSGKVPVSQLPSSVVTYLGTWNAATNTPTLANGTGDAGDMYLCNVAGTVDFGAGPITFAVGDWVLYGSGTWQKSNGQNGTVTSVAVTESGDALTITGSPITTSGTINIGFAGTSAQYVAGNGSLITFPSLTGYVPYTGATADVDLDTHVLNAQALHVKGTAGAGHLGLKHQTATPTGSANESLLFANVNGDLGWQNDNLYLTTLASHANTADRVYTFPNTSGTVALTSDLSSYVPYTGATADVDLGVNNFKANTLNIPSAGSTNQLTSFANTSNLYSGSAGLNVFGFNVSNNIYFGKGSTNGGVILWTNSQVRYYTLPNADGTLALTSQLTSGTVTSVGLSSATSGVTIGSSPVTTSGTITLAIATASGSQQGLLSSTDWTTFNSKQNALSGTGFVKIIGTTISYDNTSYLPLSGGTLTGALNGTSAAFSSSISAGGSITTSYAGPARLIIQSTTNSNNSGLYFSVKNSSGTTQEGGIYYIPGTTPYLTLSGDNSGTHLNITSAGNVGIGTSSPTETFTLAGSARITGQATDFSSGTRGVNIDVISSSGNGRIYMVNGTGTAGDLLLGTASTERMRITSGGQILFGSTSTPYNTALFRSSYGSNTYFSFGPNNNSNSWVLWNDSGSGVYLTSGNSSWSSASDERLKNINSSIDNAVEKLMTLRTVNFSWKSDETNKENLGLIAQDVQKVFPQLIDKNTLPNDKNESTEYLGVRYVELVPVLIAAIKELKAEIDELKNK